MKKRVFSVIIGILLLAGCTAYVCSLLFDFELSSLLAGWWTVFLIIPGLMGLCSRGSRLGGLGLTLLGAGLLAREQDAANGLLYGYVKDIGVWEMLLAIFLLLAGIAIIGSGFRRKKHKKGEIYGKHFSDDGDEIDSVFNSDTLDYTGQVFSGKEINNVFGNIEIDLRGAIIEKDCKIDATSVFGNLTIYIGDQANYRVMHEQVFGSIQGGDHIISDELPTVTIEANAVFGEIVICG